MSKQIPECVIAFNCEDCEKVETCIKWKKLLEKQNAEAERLMEEVPTIIHFFGWCGLKTGTIEDWQEELERLAFGC